MHAFVRVVYRADMYTDVWPSRHYGSGPRPCVCVGACIPVCLWYTYLTCIQDVYGLADIMGQVLGSVFLFCFFNSV